jgi:chromosome segregation ATPase
MPALKKAPVVSGGYARIIPSNIMKDKERLYEDTLHLKAYLNNVVNENTRLKARNHQLEEDNAKLGRLIESQKLASHGQSSIMQSALTGRQSESALIVSLKNNVKTLRTELTQRDQELLEMKRALKYTKMKEIEVEAKSYAEEVIRLKAVIDTLAKEKTDNAARGDGEFNTLEEKYLDQNNLIDNLRRDNTELAAAIKILQEDLGNGEALKELHEKNLAKANLENAKLKKAVMDRDREIQELHHQLTQYSMGIDVKQRSKEKEY